jgi:hypothetical protein
MKKNHLAKLFGALAMAVMAAALMAPFAQATTPAPGYEQFAGCPSPSENPIITSCQRSVIQKGSIVKIGSKEVPIENPITLSGGTDENLENFSANAKGGLTVVKQKVPGGVIGLTGLTWLLEFLGSEALTLYAATEAAGLPKITSLQELSTPVKVHLINGVLGNNCYIGSFTSPIVFHLTTGKSGKLTGTPPKISFQESPEILFAKEGKYVDNTFSAPGASGCVLTLFGFIPISINGLVNSQSGLPAASGTNETTQIITTEVAASESVYP